MKFRITVYSRIPYTKEFEVTGEYSDDSGDLLTEIHYLTEYKLFKGRISGFSVMRVEREA